MKSAEPDHVLDGNPSTTSPKLTQEEIDKKRFEDEADGLEALMNCPNVRLVEALAAIKIGNEYYFIFPWASGGNLLDLWERYPTPKSSKETVKWALREIHALSGAVKHLHSLQYGRHGDLKPENVLCFKEENDTLGYLYVADMGLVKFHATSTAYRSHPTRSMAGTWKYCPPEEKTTLREQRQRSRVYDVWSMGCIYLEFLVWLLYGFSELKNWKSTFSEYFSITTTASGEAKAEVHNNVQTWIRYMEEKDPRIRNSALGDVLKLVKTRLLVVPIENDPGARATSEMMDEELTKIYTKAGSNDGYLIRGPSVFQSPRLDSSTQQTLGPTVPQNASLRASETRGITSAFYQTTQAIQQDNSEIQQLNVHRGLNMQPNIPGIEVLDHVAGLQPNGTLGIPFVRTFYMFIISASATNQNIDCKFNAGLKHDRQPLTTWSKHYSRRTGHEK